MNEVKKCSLSGIAFTMDIDAYQTLSDYLESLKKSYDNSPDGAEIIADIEARIAELILSVQDNAQVVEKPLVLNIIRQMGSAEDIAGEDPDSDLQPAAPRIPRRLYRDTENAKLGGVCTGIGRYFDIDPVWVRLGLFAPLLLTILGEALPFGNWMPHIFSNLFGIFVICYLIMWFAVPAARTARQKLEMNGERITIDAIRTQTETASAAAADADARAKPIIAEAVSVGGKLALILMKIIAGMIVFGLIMAACGLIIGLFALIVGGQGLVLSALFADVSLWIPILGIVCVLLPVVLLIYVFMCLIASRKPGGKSILVLFLLWLLAMISCATIAIREHTVDRVFHRYKAIERTLNTPIMIDGDTTSVRRMMEEYEDENIIEEGEGKIHMRVPSRSLDITVDKEAGKLKIETDGHAVEVEAQDDDEQATLSIRRAEPAKDPAPRTDETETTTAGNAPAER